MASHKLITYSLDRSQPTSTYPIPGITYAENDNSTSKWDAFFEKTPLSDPRLGPYARRETLDHSRIQLYSKEDENLLLLDKATGVPVLGVYQHLLGDETTVRLIDCFIIEYAKRVRSTMRKHDVGSTFNIGETSGNLSDRMFGPARNLKTTVKKAIPINEHDDDTLRYIMACLSVHVWNEAKKVLPKEICADYEAATKKLGGMGSGSLLLVKEGVLRYTFQLGARTVKYKTASLAPCGVVGAVNYGKEIHNEGNMNTNCVSYTTHRTHDQNHGTNFINASYGPTLVPNRSDQLVFWRSQDYHGTTLPVVEPEDEHPEVQTRGMAFIMAEGFPAAYKNYLKAKRDDTTEHEVPEYVKKGVVLTITDAQPPPTKNLGKRKSGRKAMSFATTLRIAKKTPAEHKYKSWKLEALWKEVETRRGKGHAIVGGKGWPMLDLQKALLVDDGVELEDGQDVERPGRRKKPGV